MSTQSLSEKVDRLGKLQIQKAKLCGEIMDLERELKQTLQVGETAEGKKFSATVWQRVTRPLIPEKVMKIVSGKHLAKIIAIKKEAAAKVMTPDEIQKCQGKPKKAYWVDTKPIK